MKLEIKNIQILAQEVKLKLNRNLSHKEKKFREKLQLNKENVELLNNRWAEINLEYLTKSKTTFSAYLYQEELVANYNFFFPMLGLIDKELDSIKEKLTSKEEIKPTEKEQLVNNGIKLITFRKEIYDNYLENTNKNELIVISDTFKKYPSYKKLEKIKEEQANYKTEYSLHENAIKAYLNGYKEKSSSFNFDNTIIFYQKLYREIKKNKENNIEKIKTLKQI